LKRDVSLNEGDFDGLLRQTETENDDDDDYDGIDGWSVFDSIV